MIYQNITETMFKDSFKALRPDNFSYEGLSELYDYLTDMSEDCGDIELDVIAICCDFSEEPLSDVLFNYNLESLEHLQESTIVIAELDNGNVVYQVF